MSTKYEYNDTGAVPFVEVSRVLWVCQTFTPQITHYITKVKLFLYTNEAETSSDVVVAIQNTTGDDNHPDGTDLTSATFDRAELTTDEASEWKEIVLSKYRVVKDTIYAIVLRMPDAEGDEVVNWWLSMNGDTYSRGSSGWSTDGVNWEMLIGEGGPYDCLFEEWGVVGAHRHHPTIPNEPNRGKELSEMGSLR